MDMAVVRLHIDIETRSRIDLKKAGVYRYVECPDFKVMLISWAIDGGDVHLIDLMDGEEASARFIEALTDPRYKKIAFNAQFERTCLAKHFDIDCPPEQWECTQVHALEMGIPGRLGEVGERVGIPEDRRKLGEGGKLIRTFCIPQASSGEFKEATDYPEEWARFRHYCVQDTIAEREIHRRLSKFPLDKNEYRLWCLDQRINDRGVRIDERLAEAAIALAKTQIDELESEACSLTGLDNPRSRQQLLDWLRTEQILENLEETVDLKKKTVAKLLRTDQPKMIEEVLRIRQEISKSSIAKYSAMLRGRCNDGRVRGLLQFYGAIRTGRWAGRLVQIQNLPQNQIEEIDDMRRVLLSAPDTLPMLHDSPLTVLSELIRTAFIPSPGNKIGAVDFSAIEARVIAWYAQERWRLEVFRGDGRIYEASAEQMFKLPAGSVGKKDPLRQKGKIGELACGFQGGEAALEKMGALDMGLTSEELPEIKARWREASPRIVHLWYAMESAAKRAIGSKGERIYVDEVMVGQLLRNPHVPPFTDEERVPLSKVSFEFSSACLFMYLPSGRRLVYPKARVEEGDRGAKVTFMGLHPVTHKWARVDTFGGRLVENLVQATARDCLATAMLRLKKYDIVFHVHDEVVMELPPEQQDMDRIVEIVSAPIDWAPGLPLAAAGDILDWYKKT